MDTPAIGHNNPPPGLVELPSPEFISEQLGLKYADNLKRFDELAAAFDRVPVECTTDEMAGKMGDFKDQLTTCAKTLDTLRTLEKGKFDTLAKVAHGFFKNRTDALDILTSKLKQRIKVYLDEKEKKARAVAEAAAAEARAQAKKEADEAQALAAANMPKLADQQITQAATTEKQAQKLEQIATAKPAELTRTRGVEGSVSSLKRRLVGRITDRQALDLNALRPYFAADDLQKAVNAFVRANGKSDVLPTLNGATIDYETYI